MDAIVNLDLGNTSTDVKNRVDVWSEELGHKRGSDAGNLRKRRMSSNKKNKKQTEMSYDSRINRKAGDHQRTFDSTRNDFISTKTNSGRSGILTGS